MVMAQRILFTGSQDWTDRRVLARAVLVHCRPGDTIVHGAAVGLDTLIGEMWVPFGLVEAYPAWRHGGPKPRNLYMISLDITKCLSFAMSWASGTGHCARHARLAGIPTFDFGVDTHIEMRYAAFGPVVSG
jgi:hypothetical protein